MDLDQGVLYFWDPFRELFFHRNSTAVEISFWSHPTCSQVIAMNFCGGGVCVVCVEGGGGGGGGL